MITLQDVKSGTSYQVKEGTTLQQVYEEYARKAICPLPLPSIIMNVSASRRK